MIRTPCAPSTCIRGNMGSKYCSFMDSKNPILLIAGRTLLRDCFSRPKTARVVSATAVVLCYRMCSTVGHCRGFRPCSPASSRALSRLDASKANSNCERNRLENVFHSPCFPGIGSRTCGSIKFRMAVAGCECARACREKTANVLHVKGHAAFLVRQVSAS